MLHLIRELWINVDVYVAIVITIHTKISIWLKFTKPHVIPNLYDFISSVEQKMISQRIFRLF